MAVLATDTTHYKEANITASGAFTGWLTLDPTGDYLVCIQNRGTLNSTVRVQGRHPLATSGSEVTLGTYTTAQYINGSLNGNVQVRVGCASGGDFTAADDFYVSIEKPYNKR